MVESRKQNKGHWSSQGQFDFPAVALEHAVEVREELVGEALARRHDVVARRVRGQCGRAR